MFFWPFKGHTEFDTPAPDVRDEEEHTSREINENKVEFLYQGYKPHFRVTGRFRVTFIRTQKLAETQEISSTRRVNRLQFIAKRNEI